MRVMKLNVMMTILMLVWICFASTAKAEGLRSYVSVSGSDNRACTRNQPCRSFDAALAKTDEGGEIVALDTGTYDPTTITKSITLTAVPGVDAQIRASSGNAVTLNVDGADVVILRGLRLTGPGKTSTGTTGVLVNLLPNGGGIGVSVHIENCFISEFQQGVQMEVTGGRLMVSETVIRRNQVGTRFYSGGIEYNGASIERTRFEQNEIGLLVDGIVSVAVSNSIASSNFHAFQSEGNGKIEIFNTVATRNSTAIKANGGVIRIASCSLVGNGRGVSTSPGVVASMGNNMIVGNDLDVVGPNFTTFAAR